MAAEAISNRPVSFCLEITNISKNDSKDRRIIAGYGSLDVIDRQGEKITQEAMRKALEKFMANPEFANTHVMHGNVAVGKVIPDYTDMNGEKWETKVNETGTFIVSELRTDIKRAEQVWDLIQDGHLKSYSVGGISLNPKELVCQDTGACHWEINEIEIHEFSYVDRPAVKGADFIIVKSADSLDFSIKNNDLPPKAMTCPLKKEEEGGQTYKPDSHKSDVIIMTDTQAEVSEVTAETEQAVSPKPETVAVQEESSDETEKADASPILMELKAMVEKLTNTFEHYINPPEDSTKFDYPEEEVTMLKEKYGDENTFHLLTILGDDYSKLLGKAEKAPEEEPASEPDPEPEAEAETVAEEPVATEVVEDAEVVPEPAPEDEESKTEEEAPALDKSQIIDEIQVAMDEKVKEFEETISKFAKVQKRSPVPKDEVKPKSLLERVSELDWRGVDELAQRGA